MHLLWLVLDRHNFQLGPPKWGSSEVDLRQFQIWVWSRDIAIPRRVIRVGYGDGLIKADGNSYATCGIVVGVHGGQVRLSVDEAVSELGLPDQFSFEEAKRIYRKQVLRWHPDTVRQAKQKQGDAEEKIRKLNSAWQVMTELFCGQRKDFIYVSVKKSKGEKSTGSHSSRTASGESSSQSGSTEGAYRTGRASSRDAEQKDQFRSARETRKEEAQDRSWETSGSRRHKRPWDDEDTGPKCDRFTGRTYDDGPQYDRFTGASTFENSTFDRFTGGQRVDREWDMGSDYEFGPQETSQTLSESELQEKRKIRLPILLSLYSAIVLHLAILIFRSWKIVLSGDLQALSGASMFFLLCLPSLIEARRWATIGLKFRVNKMTKFRPFVPWIVPISLASALLSMWNGNEQLMLVFGAVAVLGWIWYLLFAISSLY